MVYLAVTRDPKVIFLLHKRGDGMHLISSFFYYMYYSGVYFDSFYDVPHMRCTLLTAGALPRRLKGVCPRRRGS
jgi:hypothetical protein